MWTVCINPLDNTFRSGHFDGATPENLSRIGGQTGAGAVVASKSDAFNGGNLVFVRGPGFGIMIDSTWCEFVAAPDASLSLIPDGIDDELGSKGPAEPKGTRANVRTNEQFVVN
jgi:NADPH2:quinone reductase